MSQHATTSLNTVPAANASWLAEALAAFERDGDRAAIDVVFRSVNRLLNEGRFGEIDGTLASIPAASMPQPLLIAVLTITFVPRRHLPARAALFDAAHQALRERAEDADLILRGLK
jgi:hypothetical protein